MSKYGETVSSYLNTPEMLDSLEVEGAPGLHTSQNRKRKQVKCNNYC